MQNFKQIEAKTPEIMHFHFFNRIAFVTLYLSENDAKNLQSGDVYLALIADFGMIYLEIHLAH